LAGNDNVVIAKMDYTANEVDVKGMSVKGFPTIYFFKGDDKSNPIKYEEGRELKDLLKFLVTLFVYLFVRGCSNSKH
jgi:hypothetical protein